MEGYVLFRSTHHFHNKLWNIHLSTWVSCIRRNHHIDAQKWDDLSYSNHFRRWSRPLQVLFPLRPEVGAHQTSLFVLFRNDRKEHSCWPLAFLLLRQTCTIHFSSRNWKNRIDQKNHYICETSWSCSGFRNLCTLFSRRKTRRRAEIRKNVLCKLE